jgi:biotin carboxyl carrier protein
MSLEVIIGERTAEVEIIEKDNNIVKIAIDGKIYDIDIVMVENGVFSILHNNKSYNVELTRNTAKNYTVNTLYESFEVEIVDAQSKYIKNRGLGDTGDDADRIFSPMPGKVVKINVQVGDVVPAGETVIVVEAMKMQSEYKVKSERVIKEVLVNEGDTVESNQTLIILE